MPDRLDEIAAQLYALPPEEFVAARTAAARQARSAGDRLLAAQVGELRRPTLGAWLVNLLAHERPELVADLLDLGDALRTAQRELRGDELRELSQRRRRTVTALAREAGALAVAAGRGAGGLPLAEVESTLTAALAEPAVAERVRAGRLVKPVAYAGFGEVPRPQLTLVRGGADTEPGRAAATGGATRPASSSGDDRRAVEAERRAAEAERRAAEAEHRAARAERHTEERRLAAERAAAEREAQRRAAAERRRARAAAQRELLAARTELAEAEAVRVEAERAVRAARRRVEKAAAAVEAAGPPD